ncbi:hypothetical protein TRFO_22387 [Tritrichomonas foetus]|uniref:HNH nuclease domain-containing protein n=1 Tax=Tritrichomonas foetus TaxID=1144522 RepID=A0A1J4KGH3_9EUKA|nr:hypothetical protein TRFO_22387 [Tritrichomonas foetus]|eukprot:OHT08900.1 hypothetical protein TRFO_22387 [Tritrichomonas foetus]
MGYVFTLDKDGKWVRNEQNEGIQYRRVKINRHWYSVHRLVAMTFLPTEDMEHLEVIFRNHDPTDNRADNLFWGTHKYSTNHQQRQILLDELPEDAYRITTYESRYGVWYFDDLYFSPSNTRLYVFNGESYAQISYSKEMKSSKVTDVDGNRHTLSFSKIRQQYE